MTLFTASIASILPHVGYAVLPLMIGTTELFIIALIVILLFGGKKIPELMRSLGQGVRFFKKGLNEDLPSDTTDAKVSKDDKAEPSAENK